MPAQEIIPSGIATEATLASINTKTPTVGQKAMAASAPVVIASDQSAVPVSGTVTANTGLTQPLTDAQLRATSVPVSVSGTVPVSGGLTDTQLRATAVDVSLASLPALATGANVIGGVTQSGTWNVGVTGNVEITNDAGNAIPVNQAGVTATGSLGALNATQALSLTGASGWAIDVRGTFVGTITFQGTIDGTNWFSISVVPAGGGVNVAAVTTTTAVGAWVGSANGMQQVRANMTAYTSGSATIVLRAMQAVGVVQNYPTGQTTQPVSGTVTATVSNATVTSANLGISGIIADVASAALATTTTTVAFTPTFGCSYEVNIPVTAVSGTTPTLDVRIEESDDTAGNWFTVYEFPRITATGIYRSPKLPLTGNRVRYVQTVTGTTPSFTRAINRLQSSDSVDSIRQIVDRSVSLTTLNAATPALTVVNCRNVSMTVNVGAITTTAPALQMEGSDDNGATWYSVGSPLTAVASSSVKLTVNAVNCQLLRARVSTAGVGVTAGYVLVRAF